MGMRKLQRTIESSIECCGIGLHSGKSVSLSLKPLPQDSGIWFRRTDLPHRPYIKASHENVTQTALCTTLGNNGSSISTVEHLMAAFSGLGIQNVLVEVDAPEVPIMDGSARGFVDLILETGLKNQGASQKIRHVEDKFTISQEDKKISFYPNKNLIISFTIEFDHPLVKKQEYTFQFSEQRFIEEISGARTFGFLKEVEWMQQQGYALGGSLDNAVVIDDSEILNPEGLRYPNEFVRHKILDFLGDLYLYGKPICGHFVIFKSGHSLNHVLVRHLENKQAQNSPTLSSTILSEQHVLFKNELLLNENRVINHLF